jgi:hypothetical protein
MTTPIIVGLTRSARFRFLWLKYVQGVNLNVHCAKCLKGSYSKRIDRTRQYSQMIGLDEDGAKYYYLCGVAEPYIWAKNFHLAFELAPGEMLHYESNGIEIAIIHARQIEIKTLGPESHPDKAFFTCRNWQFANQIAPSFALPRPEYVINDAEEDFFES